MNKLNSPPKIVSFHQKFFNVFAKLFPKLLHLHYGLNDPRNPLSGNMFQRLKNGSIQLLDTICLESDIPNWPSNFHGLDIGCGLGGTTIYLNQKYGFKMEGINITPEQVKLANERINSHQLSKDIHIVQGDAQELPYENESFNFVIMIEVAFHIKDKDKVMKEIYRVLKPDGYFLLIDQECINEDNSVMDMFYFVKYGTYKQLAHQNQLSLMTEIDLSKSVANWMQDYSNAARLPFHLLVFLYAILKFKPKLAWDYLIGIIYFNQLILKEIVERKIINKTPFTRFRNGIYGLRKFTQQELIDEQTKYKLFVIKKKITDNEES